MRAINTEYKGYLFRSRLEARWAVYFDELGIKWQYEIEGFEDGKTRYLPDFYFTDFDVWAEVKPEGHNKKDLKKWLMFGEEKCLVILEGIPHSRPSDCYTLKDILLVIPFAHLMKSSYGFLWYAAGDEDWAEYEPFESAIKKANQIRF